MNIEYKKSGQIPRFGDWDNANELPITQYFECARQAGLVPYSSSVEYEQCVTNGHGRRGGGGDLYAVGNGKPSLRAVYVPPRKINKRRSGAVKEQQSRQIKVRNANVMDHHPKYHKPLSQKQLPKHTYNKSTDLVVQRPATTVKPVDEDLYKIPPELLHKSERKKMLGFLSRCLAPPCTK